MFSYRKQRTYLLDPLVLQVPRPPKKTHTHMNTEALRGSLRRTHNTLLTKSPDPSCITFYDVQKTVF